MEAEKMNCHAAGAATSQSSRCEVLCPVIQQRPAAVEPLRTQPALDLAVPWVLPREMRGQRPLSREGEQAQATFVLVCTLVVPPGVQLQQPHVGEHLGAVVTLVRTVRRMGVEVGFQAVLRSEHLWAEMAAVTMRAGPSCVQTAGSPPGCCGEQTAPSISGVSLFGL